MPYSSLTKNAFALSIKELMRDVPFSKISIGDICIKCGLNRKTFYYHFKDKYDLVNWIFQTEFLELMKVRSYSSGWQFISDICGYLYSERVFYNNALQYDGQNSFREYFSSTVGNVFQIIIRESRRAAEDPQFFAIFMTDALLMSIIRWLTQVPTLSPVEFVKKLRNAMSMMAEQNF